MASRPQPSFATPLTPLLGQGAERIIELMEVRSAVEIEAAGLAARRATLEDLHRLAILLTAPGDVLSPEEDVAFHAAIAVHPPDYFRLRRGRVVGAAVRGSSGQWCLG